MTQRGFLIKKSFDAANYNKEKKRKSKIKKKEWKKLDHWWYICTKFFKP